MDQIKSNKKTFIIQYQADVEKGSRTFDQIKNLLLEDDINPDMLVSDIRYKGFFTDSEEMIQLVPEGKAEVWFNNARLQSPEKN